jgi:hypothetical protein
LGYGQCAAHWYLTRGHDFRFGLIVITPSHVTPGVPAVHAFICNRAAPVTIEKLSRKHQHDSTHPSTFANRMSRGDPVVFRGKKSQQLTEQVLNLLSMS